MLPSYAADGVLDPPEEWGGDGEHEEGDEEVLVDSGPRHLQRPDKKDLLGNIFKKYIYPASQRTIL